MYIKLMVKLFSSKAISLLFLLIFVKYSLSDNPQHIQMELEKPLSGEVKKDDAYEYYKLVIPQDVEKNSKNLVFEVKEDKSTTAEGEEMFSDPDIHISKSNDYPARFNSDWYSERYGDDIVSISKENVNPGDIFYVGMYCQFKCKYTIKAYLTESVDLEISYVYSVLLHKSNSLNFVYKIPEGDYEQFIIIASSPYLNEFKFFAEKDSPSSQHTFNIIPSWAGGYLVTVDKGSKNYCTNCNIEVLLKGNDYEDSTVQLYAYFQNKETVLTSGNPIYDYANAKGKRCYKYHVDDFHERYGKGLIIQVTLFSGFDSLAIHGWEPNDKEFSQIDKDNYFYSFASDLTVKLDKTDFDKFNQKNPTTGNKGKDLNFCLYAQQKSSYAISAHSIADVPALQKYNFIFAGNEIKGFMLKDQVTRYRVVEYGEKSDLDITVTVGEGELKAFVFFCYQTNCYFTKDLIKEKKDKGELLLPTNWMNGYKFSIPDSDNKCHHLGLEETKKINCSPLVIVECSGESELCDFKIRVTSNTTSILMSPKTTYYNILPAKQADTYDIIVEDENINSVVIVLNSASGDAELLVYKYPSIESTGTSDLIGLSLNDDYIPDVVRITKKNTNSTSLIGKYQVKIVTKIFSSYHLYYYVTYPPKKEIDYSDVMSEISSGEIIYDIFPLDRDFQIYSYTPKQYTIADNEDIKITLKSVNLKFTFLVYLDLQKIETVPGKSSFEKYKGYVWKSGYNSELVIKKSDPNYTKKGPYYIVVIKDFDDSEVVSDSIASLYIDITTPSTPLQLIEGLEHKTVLTDEFKFQTYWYTHYDLNSAFELNLNLFSGIANIYANTTSFTSEDISNTEKKNTLAIADEYIRTSGKYTISAENLKRDCGLLGRCEIFIVVQRASRHSNVDYLISGKSQQNKMELITAGLVKTGSMRKHQTRYFYVEEMKKRQATVIMVHFDAGIGDVYVRIPPRPESGENIKYPSENNYDYKGSYTYMGSYVQIPSSVYDALSPTNPKIQIQIAIVGKSPDYEEDEDEERRLIQFKISYSSDPRKISQNVPWNGFISAGEAQYYQLYFEHYTKNIYISLSNMNGGDADLYMNYGLDPLPTSGNSDWYSANPGHEFLSIKEDDPVFKKKELRNMGGVYSLLVIGYTNTSFTLFISSGDEVIFPMMENSPITCKCEKENDKCYFNYDNFDLVYATSFTEEKTKADMIFASQYVYGSGQLYAKFIDSSEFYAKENVINAFPTEKDHYKTKEYFANQNLLKVSFDKSDSKISRNSLLLLTLKCNERSLVGVTAASGGRGDTFRLDESRDNIFYFSEIDHENFLMFYNYIQSEIFYEIESYSGEADIIVYVNSTIYDDETGEYKTKYTHLASIKVGKNDEYEYDGKLLSDLYQNSIKPYSAIANQNIIFKLTTKKPIALKIKIYYSKKWINIPMSRPVNFVSKLEGVLGYFDVTPDYTSAEFSITLEEKVGKRARVYIKYQTVEKKKKSYDPEGHDKEEQAYNYTIPSPLHRDYRIITDKVLGKGAAILKDFPKVNDDQILRVLFRVIIEKVSYETEDDDENEYSEYSSDNIAVDTPFYITVTPQISGSEKLFTTPKTYHQTMDYFSPNLEKSKSFIISTTSPLDDTIVIEISSCTGEYRYRINAMEGGERLQSRVEYSHTKYGGREIITITNLKASTYEVVVSPRNSLPICQNKGNTSPLCNNLVSYLFYYYPTTKENYKYSLINATFTYQTYGRGGIKIIVPRLKEVDAFGNQRDMEDMHFDVFLSNKPNEYELMESVCYLSEMAANSTNEKKLYKNIKMKHGKIYIKGLKSGASYYLNLLAQNPRTGELITFKPMQVYSGTFFSSISGFTIFLVILIILVLAGLVYYFYKRFKSTEAALRFEENDLGRMAHIPKATAEMANISQDSERIKYSTLTANADTI
ncbi:MAG: hypothetical protein MJ252_01495 [archaeon]|nr:hypothetical protein [archaeon]